MINRRGDRVPRPKHVSVRLRPTSFGADGHSAQYWSDAHHRELAI